MLLPTDLLTHIATRLGLEPMVTAGDTVTHHRMVMQTQAQTPAADALLTGCHRPHHSLVQVIDIR